MASIPPPSATPRSWTQTAETILSNEDNQPTQIFEHPESTPYYVNDLLTNVVENGTGKLAAIDGMDVAGKTGTTTDNKDRWFAGYTPYYVGVCWFGYDEGYGLPTLKPNPALALWSDVMDELHEDKENKRFDQPNEDDFVEAEYCLDSGMAPSKACYSDVRGSRVATGKFYKDDVPEEECTMHKWRTNSRSLLDLTRKFPIGVTVTDEYYCFSGSNDPIGEVSAYPARTDITASGEPVRPTTARTAPIRAGGVGAPPPVTRQRARIPTPAPTQVPTPARRRIRPKRPNMSADKSKSGGKIKPDKKIRAITQ